MSRFRNELHVIPRVVWILAPIIYIMVALVLLLVVVQNDTEIRTWESWQQNLFSFGIPAFVFIFVLLIGYVNGDARRRGMRYVMWTLLATFVPNAVGIILYFLMRDPLPAPCPGCGTVVRGGFVFCPHCGTALKPSCPQCGRAVEGNWTNCAYCGTKLPARKSAA